MVDPPVPIGQFGLPELLPDLVGIASAIVLILIVVAVAAAVYRHYTGGIEWPEPDEDSLEAGDEDDEWDYY